MSVKKLALTAIWDQMDKLYGGETGLSSFGKIETITSGSYLLDDVIGNGWGLPRGRLIQYAGKEGSGKTLMSLVAIKEWQKLNPKNWAVFLDAEYSFNKTWAASIGVDLDRIKVVPEEDGVKIFTYLCGVPHKELGKEKQKLGLLDMVKEQGGSDASGLGIIVLDSIAMIKSPVEATKAVGNTNMGPMARFLPDALRRLKPLLAQTGVVFIAINQVRVDLGKMFGDPTSTPGGKALKHAEDVMVHFTSSDSLKSKFLDANDEPYGHVAGARIDKSKVGPSFKKCLFDLEYTKGVVNKNKEMAMLAIRYGAVERPNNKTYVYGDLRWNSKEAFYEALNDEILFANMFAKIREAKATGVSPCPAQNEKPEGWDDDAAAVVSPPVIEEE
jgi:recombination protein RecA